MVQPVIRLYKNRFAGSAAAGLIMLLAALIAITPASAGYDTVKVMTRNLYLGADIFTIIQAAEVRPPDMPEEIPDTLAVPWAVSAVFQTIQHTDFPERVEAIADEIMRFRPHLIGLQEVTRIRVQDGSDFFEDPAPNASIVVYDFLTLLTDALADRGLDYQLAVVGENADVELPALAGFDGAAPLFQDVRLTDHDVILVRGDVGYSAPLASNYKLNVSASIGGASLEFTRGYVALDAQVDGEAFRFVNTHLEVYGGQGSPFAAIQAAQMNELLTGLSTEILPVILVGDFNSSPEHPPYDDTTYGPIAPPYLQAAIAGYTDAWLEQHHGDEGFTCCFNETVDDPEAGLYERIDHAFIKPQASALGPTQTRTIGDQSIFMPPNGLWPSDHAGVIARIKFK